MTSFSSENNYLRGNSNSSTSHSLFNIINENCSVEQQALNEYKRSLNAIIEKEKEEQDQKNENKEGNKKEEEKYLTEEISFSEAEFLQKLLSIKKKIAKLYKEYNEVKEKVNQLDLEIKEMNAVKDQKESFHSSFQQFIIHYFKDEKEVKEKLEMAQINDCVVSECLQGNLCC